MAPRKREWVIGNVDCKINLPPTLKSGDIVIPLPTIKGGTNLRAGHELERICRRGLKFL